MKYNFQLISDVHLEMGFYHSIKPKAPYLLLAGDIGYPETQIFRDFIKQCSKKFVKVFYTSGNHEYYQCKKNGHKCIEEIDVIIAEVCAQFENVYYLQNSYYDFDDLRIVGSTLWSDVDTELMINDYTSIYKSDRDLITTSDTVQMYNKNKEYLENVIEASQKPVLIMTHHLPSYQMILPIYETSPYKSHFASDLNYLFKKPVIGWVCGHSHGFNRQMINGIKCIINAIGYTSEPRRGASINFAFDCDV